MLLSEQAYKKIDRELAKFPADQRQSAIMASLAIAVQEVATFYNMFDVKPVGTHKIAVCTNLPCALRDGEKAADYLKRKLGVDFRETTADGRFTLIEGECMGACGDSPVLIVNNKHMCVRMTEEKLDALVDGLKSQGESA